MSSSALPVTRTSLRLDTVIAFLRRAAPALAFLGPALLLWLMFGHRLILSTNDEGIYLDAAERILHGQKPYVDFFGYMSPGSFWLQALAFRLLGVTLAAGRILVVLYIALECALIYWLVQRFASRSAGLCTLLIFLGFQMADPSMITAQHRWDSSALSLASIVLCLRSQDGKARGYLMASGMVMVLAALATPSIALVGIATLSWLATRRKHRSHAGWYLLGLSAGGLIAAVALWSEGIFQPLIRQLEWLSRNYSAVNVMPYGAIIGGYEALFDGARLWELPVRICVVFCVALPALLPVVAISGGIVLWRRDYRDEASSIAYLLLCTVALAASTYPRADVTHLAYVAALSYAIVAILVYRYLRARMRAYLTIAAALWSLLFALQAPALGGQRIHTPVGDIRANTAEGEALQTLLSHVRPHQLLFVYPYKPLLYFLTQTGNPTRYAYLAPGMMTNEDARVALSELQAHPPAWVLYLDLTRAEFERVFPAAKGSDPHYRQLENWINAKYRSAGSPPLGGYVLLRREPEGQ
jgi:4-amino-4-deoxy-L-arabinose transferase-like glycosyltransferase